MAAAFYNKQTNTHDADSMGTHVEKSGQTLLARKLERPDKSFVVDVMKEVGINIEQRVSTQLTKEVLSKYDLIINMAGKHYTPKWLSNAPNYVYWKVRDPMGRSRSITAGAREKVFKKVQELIAQQ